MSELRKEQVLAATPPAPRLIVTPPPPDTGPVCLPVAGHELTIFVETGPLIRAMVRDIQTARRRIWLETYIFHDDRAGGAVAEALRERSRAGVEVRVLYDAIGSNATPWHFFRRLEQDGVQVQAFHSL